MRRAVDLYRLYRILLRLVIPVDQDVGSMISFNHASHFDQAISYGDGPKKLIHQIDMRIVDPHGHTLDPSIPFTVTLGYH